MPGRHVEGQLVLRALQPIGGCDLRKYCVGTGDGAVHGSVSGMVGELQVHGGGRALGVDVQLQRVQCALVRFPCQPRGEAAAEGGYGRLVGSDEALGDCQIGCQRIGREVRRRWDGGYVCLQRGHGGRVGPNGGGVGGRVREGRIGRQDSGQLPCRDALHLDGGDGGLAIVEDVPGDGRLEKTHVLLYQSRLDTPAELKVQSWNDNMCTKHWSARSASMLLKLKRHRSPERVEMPESGCFGTLSTGKAATNCVFPNRLSRMRMLRSFESYVPARISKK